MVARLHRPGRLIALGAEVLLGAVVVALVGGWVAGWHLTVVTTGSMGDAVPEGSLAVTRPVAVPNVGDVIAFTASRDDEPVLHRVVSVVDRQGEVRVQTKGDANADVDPGLVELDQVQGRVAFSAPVLGRVVRSLRGVGAVAILVVAIAAFALAEWRGARRGRRAAPTTPAPTAA